MLVASPGLPCQFTKLVNTALTSNLPVSTHNERPTSQLCAITMSTFLQSLNYFFKLPFHIQWRTALVQLPRWVPLSVLHFTSRKGPQPFLIALPSRRNNIIPIYVFVPPAPVDLDGNGEVIANGEWKVPVVLDFHGGG